MKTLEENLEIEALYPTGYVKEKHELSANERQTLQAQADEMEILLPTELNRPPYNNSINGGIMLPDED